MISFETKHTSVLFLKITIKDNFFCEWSTQLFVAPPITGHFLYNKWWFPDRFAVLETALDGVARTQCARLRICWINNLHTHIQRNNPDHQFRSIQYFANAIAWHAYQFICQRLDHIKQLHVIVSSSIRWNAIWGRFRRSGYQHHYFVRGGRTIDPWSTNGGHAAVCCLYLNCYKPDSFLK